MLEKILGRAQKAWGPRKVELFKHACNASLCHLCHLWLNQIYPIANCIPTSTYVPAETMMKLLALAVFLACGPSRALVHREGWDFTLMPACRES